MKQPSDAVPRSDHTGVAQGDGVSEHVTEHLGLATYLSYRGHPVTVAAEGARCVFHFPASDGLLQDINAFADGTAKELRRYEATRAELRRLMDSSKRAAR